MGKNGPILLHLHDVAVDFTHSASHIHPNLNISSSRSPSCKGSAAVDGQAGTFIKSLMVEAFALFSILHAYCLGLGLTTFSQIPMFRS